MNQNWSQISQRTYLAVRNDNSLVNIIRLNITINSVRLNRDFIFYLNKKNICIFIEIVINDN